MKKLFSAILCLCIAVTASAQFGITGGLSSTSTNFNGVVNDVKNKAINQYHLGITYKIGKSNIIALQPSLIYNIKGAYADGTKTKTQLDFKTGFIELPVQLQLGFGIGKIFRLYGIAEPFIGYAVSNSVNVSGQKEKTWDNLTSRFEYGVGLGAGLELFKHFQLSARYSWNLGSLYDFSWEGMINAPKSTCSGINVSLAILL